MWALSPRAKAHELKWQWEMLEKSDLLNPIQSRESFEWDRRVTQYVQLTY